MSDEYDGELSDPLVALQAELDQAIAIAPEVARVARGWFVALQAEGFTANQALYLTAVQMQSSPGSAPS